MRSVHLLSKNAELFDELSKHLMALSYEYSKNEDSLRLNFKSGSYLLLYDRFEKNLFETHEIPEVAVSSGYRFAFLVECRDVKAFCDILGDCPQSLEILVCDANGKLFSIDELSPDAIVM